MNRPFIVCTLLLTLLPAVSAAADEQADAIAALKKRNVRVDEFKTDAGEPFCNIHYEAADLTDADFAPLGAIKNVRDLNIRSPEITDAAMREVAKLKSLQTLNVLNTKVTGAGLAPLATLPELRMIAIYGPIGKAGITALAPAPKLANVNLHGCEFQQGMLAEFAKYKSLKHLFLDAVIDDDWLKELQGCQTLEAIFINNLLVDGAGVAALAKVPKLVDVSVNCPHQIKDSHVKHFAALTNVKRLSLSGFDLTDACLPHLAKMKQLENLSMFTTKITKEGAAKLKKALPKCQIEGLPQ